MTGLDLLILAKSPRPGEVKTRLIPPCDEAQAAAIASAALEDTLVAAIGSRASRVILVLDGPTGDWCPKGVEVVPQGEGSLACRLEAAWRHACGPAVQVGMDTPQLTPPILDRLMDIAQGQALLGLATDGGWWVSGMPMARPEVFARVPTSQPDTGWLQYEEMRRHGLQPRLVETRTDVDTWEDALLVAAEVPTTRFARVVREVERMHPTKNWEASR